MAWVFSKRCQQALKEGKVKVSISRNVRLRIWYLMTNYDERWNETTETGFSYPTGRLEELAKTIKAEHGLQKLTAYSEEKRSYYTF